MLLLVDTRTPPPEPSRRRGEWLFTVINWLLPWPALVLWLLAAAMMFDGWVGVGFSWAAVGVAFWRMSQAFRGVGGLRDHIQ